MITLITRRRLAALEEALEVESEARAAAEEHNVELALLRQRDGARIANLEDAGEEVSGDLGAAEHHIEGLEAALGREQSRTADLVAEVEGVEELLEETEEERAAGEKRCEMYRGWLLHLLAHPDTRVPPGLEARMLLAMGDAEHAVMGQLMAYYADRATAPTPAIAEGGEAP